MTQRLNYTTIAPAGVKALGGVYGYIVQSGLPGPLVNLVYLRVSQINGCAYCIDMHSRDLIKQRPSHRKAGAGPGLARGRWPVRHTRTRSARLG